LFYTIVFYARVIANRKDRDAYELRARSVAAPRNKCLKSPRISCTYICKGVRDFVTRTPVNLWIRMALPGRKGCVGGDLCFSQAAGHISLLAPCIAASVKRLPESLENCRCEDAASCRPTSLGCLSLSIGACPRRPRCPARLSFDSGFRSVR